MEELPIKVIHDLKALTPEQLRLYRNARQREYYWKMDSERREYQKRYYSDNTAFVKSINQTYYEKNKERILARAKERYRLKKEAEREEKSS